MPLPRPSSVGHGKSGRQNNPAQAWRESLRSTALVRTKSSPRSSGRWGYQEEDSSEGFLRGGHAYLTPEQDTVVVSPKRRRGAHPPRPSDLSVSPQRSPGSNPYYASPTRRPPPPTRTRWAHDSPIRQHSPMAPLASPVPQAPVGKPQDPNDPTPFVNDCLTTAFRAFENAHAAAAAVDEAATGKGPGADSAVAAAADHAAKLFAECVRHFETAKSVGSIHVRAMCDSHIGACAQEIDTLLQRATPAAPPPRPAEASFSPARLRAVSEQPPSIASGTEGPKVQLSTTVRSPVEADGVPTGDMVLTTISTTLSDNIYAPFLANHTLNTVRALLEHAAELAKQIGDGPDVLSLDEQEVYQRNRARMGAMKRMLADMET
eukprot:TRINITY_DN30685_c0_g1_i1.p1 TRINITY_DN30685_c0_g1~~TRINITY_DN30685_c0_g1_i1.p1  ORF type:complete len:376 (+),score=30.15 TRINITY_DN30685_c0_g1_i1:79-1206(+)